MFQDGLDDERGVGELVEPLGRMQAGQRPVAAGGVQAALLDQPVQSSGQGVGCLARAARHGVVEPYAVPGDEGHLGDAPAHGSGADDGDGTARRDR